MRMENRGQWAEGRRRSSSCGGIGQGDTHCMTGYQQYRVDHQSIAERYVLNPQHVVARHGFNCALRTAQLCRCLATAANLSAARRLRASIAPTSPRPAIPTSLNRPSSAGGPGACSSAQRACVRSLSLPRPTAERRPKRRSKSQAAAGAGSSVSGWAWRSRAGPAVRGPVGDWDEAGNTERVWSASAAVRRPKRTSSGGTSAHSRPRLDPAALLDARELVCDVRPLLRPVPAATARAVKTSFEKSALHSGSSVESFEAAESWRDRNGRRTVGWEGAASRPAGPNPRADVGLGGDGVMKACQAEFDAARALA